MIALYCHQEVLQFSRYVAMAIFDRYKLFGGAAGSVRSRVLAVLATGVPAVSVDAILRGMMVEYDAIE